MQLNRGTTSVEIEALQIFAKWVMDIGDGKVYPQESEALRCGEDDIIIPAEFIDLNNENSIDNMMAATYPHFYTKCQDPKYLSERAIFTPTNHIVYHINSLIGEKLPGDSISYFSIDTTEDFGGTEADLNHTFPVEYLNSITKPGLPPHELKLKVGAFYVVISQVTSSGGLKIFVDDDSGMPTDVTKNVMYKEVFYALLTFYAVEYAGVYGGKPDLKGLGYSYDHLPCGKPAPQEYAGGMNKASRAVWRAQLGEAGLSQSQQQQQ
ncbi:uncharacterized protein LOC141670596 [Apium graveolens]|uniref:uncharacterized protein LOC141670596 n=1 Tax=Apium graveolens TaxID=4045 RepID=UPI003D7AAFDA